MSETEETYTIPEPTLAAQNQSLAREVDHVTEQMRVEHAQIAYWKDRALTAERALDALQRSQGRTQVKTGTSGKDHASESLTGQPDALEGLV